MKVLQVNPFFSPVHGGSARSSYEISKWLSKNGHEVTVYTSDFKLSREWIKTLPHVKVYPFKTMLCLASFFVTFGMLKTVRKNLKHFDIIHMHNYRSFQNIIVAHYALKYGVPYVLQAHGSLPIIIMNQRLKWLYDVFFGYKLLRGASKVIALSSAEAQQYNNMGVPEKKIEIMPNGIDLSEYGDLPPKGCFKRKFGIDEDEKIVLYLGRIHMIKGIDILVNAFANIVDKFNDVKLVVVGPDDGYLGELEAFIKTLKVEDNVLILGPLYGRDKLEAYVDADVYVLPSRYETFPMTLLESYACSRPVIVSNVGSLADLVVHEKTGFLFEEGNVNELVSYLEHLLSNPNDVKRMGCDAQNFVRNRFEIDKVVGMFESLYKETVSDKTWPTHFVVQKCP